MQQISDIRKKTLDFQQESIQYLLSTEKVRDYAEALMIAKSVLVDEDDKLMRVSLMTNGKQADVFHEMELMMQVAEKMLGRAREAE
jgi:hypothetical protein